MFAVSNIPVRDKELPSDEKALMDFVIELQPRNRIGNEHGKSQIICGDSPEIRA